MLKKIMLATALVSATAIGAASAEERKDKSFETGAGAVTGAAAGAVIGGPVGAVVGGVAGAAIGSATVPEPAREYVIANPVEPVVIQERVVVGATIPETVVVQPIPESPEFGYIYVENRPVVVNMQSREVVYIDG